MALQDAGVYAVIGADALHINLDTFRYAFRREGLTARTPGHLDVNYLVHTSPCVQRGDVHEEDLYKAWQLVLETLANASGHCAGLTLIVKNALEASFTDGLSTYSAARPGSCVYPQALIAFMCFSAISSQAGCTLVGDALSSFWAHRGPRIISNDAYCLDAWANAIFKACMPSSSKLASLQEFVKDPTAMEQLRYDSPTTGRILATLNEIEDYEAENFDTALANSQSRPLASRLLQPSYARSVLPYPIDRARSASPIASMSIDGRYGRRNNTSYHPDASLARRAASADWMRTSRMVQDTNRRVRRLEDDVALTKMAAMRALTDTPHHLSRPGLLRSYSAQEHPRRYLASPLGYR